MFEKNKDISKEMKRLKKILKVIPADRKPIADNLYNELIFIQRTLNNLKREVDENGTTTLETLVINNTEVDYTINKIKITVKDKEENVVTTLTGTKADTIKPGESRVIDLDTPMDLSEAVSIQYSIIK